MTDVLLIEPNYYKRPKKVREQPQLGLAYIGGYLESKGVDVNIIDAAVDDMEPREAAEAVKAHNPAVMGITGCSDDRLGMFEIIQGVRELCPDTLIVGGGPHFAYTAKDALENLPGLDVVVMGEGEHAMHEIVTKYTAGRKRTGFEGIDGIAYKDDAGGVQVAAPRKPCRDLDSMPGPAWHLFEMDKYQGIMSAGGPHRAIGVISSRGCPYACSFCANSLSKNVRYMSPARFVDEVEQVTSRYGFDAINFQDDSFTANIGHVKAICGEILSRGMKLKWYCSLRVDKASRHKYLLRLMKEAGCIALGFGIEFPSDDVLEKISKKTTVEMIETALANVTEVGFPHVAMFLMNSFPGQNRLNTMTAQLNINRFNKILHGHYPYKLTPGAWTRLYPGTEITSVAEGQGNVLPEGFSWNRYYKNPYTDWLRLGSWSMPLYESAGFPISEIKKTLEQTGSYLNVKKAWDKGGVRSVLGLASRTGGLGALIDAARVKMTLDKGGKG